MKGDSALGGVILLTGSNIIVKILGIASQMILATLISRNDFALFALSTSITAIILGFRNGGSDNILIQKGKSYSRIADKILSYSLVFNTASFLILTVLSLFASTYYHEPALIIILILNGFSLLVGTLPPILGATLSIDCRFKDVAVINLKSLSLKHITTILFAYFGLGFYAFVVPLIIQYTSASYYSYQANRLIPKLVIISRRYFFTILHSTKWIMAGNLSFQISNNSQLFIIGTFAAKPVLGVFFFCLMIINSPVALINGAISDVIFPKLALITKDKDKFNSAVLRAIKIGFSLNVVAAIISGIFLPLLIEFFWKNKWGDAIPLLNVLIFIIPSLTLIELMNFILASKGLWKSRFIMLGIFVFIETLLLIYTVINFPIIYTCILLSVLKFIFANVAVIYTFQCCEIPFSLYKKYFSTYFLPVLPIMIFSISIALTKLTDTYEIPYYSFLLITMIYYLYQSKSIFFQLYISLMRKKIATT